LRNQLPSTAWVLDHEFLASPLDRSLFIGCRNDPKALGLLLAHDVNTPKAPSLLVDAWLCARLVGWLIIGVMQFKGKAQPEPSISPERCKKVTGLVDGLW
jgi:hypothetical protein